jgi:hypothetical protein
MNAQELVKFLNVLKYYVPGYWKSRIEEVITKLGGQNVENPFR